MYSKSESQLANVSGPRFLIFYLGKNFHCSGVLRKLIENPKKSVHYCWPLLLLLIKLTVLGCIQNDFILIKMFEGKCSEKRSTELLLEKLHGELDLAIKSWPGFSFFGNIKAGQEMTEF